MKKSLFLLAGAALLCPGLAAEAQKAPAPEPPVKWIVPEGFSPRKRTLGLEQIKGIESFLLYNPKVSNADPSKGGNCAYESTLHGTYNHHQQFLLFKDYIIVFWTNHVRDENGPGQRIVGRVGKFINNGNDIDWGKETDVIEIAPPGMPPKFRDAVNDKMTVDGAFIDGTMYLSEGRIFLRGRLLLCDGWTDEPKYHFPPKTEPMPDEHYSAGKTKSHRMDCYWFLSSFAQEWTVNDEGRLVPASELYLEHKLPTEIQITPTVRKKLIPFNEPYRSAKLLSQASPDFVRALNGKRTAFQRFPKYENDAAFKAATDGKNGLAHHAEFIRPDGKYVVIRDNLLDERLQDRTYYAAVKDNADAFYPPAIRTNLFGTAMPVAGELKNGGCWIVGSDLSRCRAYITWSKDGITFDKTKLLLLLETKVTPGLCKPAVGGAQYFHTITKNDSIYLIYSIGKEKIGLTKIPMEILK